MRDYDYMIEPEKIVFYKPTGVRNEQDSIGDGLGVIGNVFKGVNYQNPGMLSFSGDSENAPDKGVDDPLGVG